jgi:hypothetical protein
MEDLTREEFERNFHIMAEMLRQGKLVFPYGYSGDSILRVQKTPNGRIDFLTVDESARLNANMMGWTNSEVIKKINRNDPEIEDE